MFGKLFQEKCQNVVKLMVCGVIGWSYHANVVRNNNETMNLFFLNLHMPFETFIIILQHLRGGLLHKLSLISLGFLIHLLDGIDLPSC